MNVENDTNDNARLEYLDALGITVWRERAAGQNPGPRAATTGNDETAAGASCDSDMAELRATVAACTRCDLHKTRTQTVFGVGNENADWLVIGEAPGAEEDRRGEPFVGRAGKLLDEMLDNGFPLVTESNILKELIKPPNMLTNVLNTVTGKSK